MEANLLLFADAANRTGNGKLNVLGIFNIINSKTFPTFHPQMYIIAGLNISPAEFGTEREMHIKICDADANIIFDWKAPINVSRPQGGGYTNFQSILKVDGVIFPKPDTYQVSLLIDNDEKATTKLFVNLVE